MVDELVVRKHVAPSGAAASYPASLKLPALFSYLDELSQCGSTPAQRVILEEQIDEYMVGLWWFVQLEFNPKFKFPWPQGKKNRRALKTGSKGLMHIVND